MKVLISGISGQDGSYLAEKLLDQGHEVFGIVRRKSDSIDSRIHHIKKYLSLHHGDITDGPFVSALINSIQPDKIFNLAGQSDVRISFDNPNYTMLVNANGALNIYEAVRNFCKTAKVYQASTSEIFGNVPDVTNKKINEETQKSPVSPYGVSKLSSFNLAKVYREIGIFVSNGILFNHESERRGENFVTKKIAKGLIDFLHTNTPILLGNIDSQRDWGYAPDFVDGMLQIMDLDSSDDYILATGECFSVRDFIEHSFAFVGKEIIWEGSGLNEIGIVNGEVAIKIDSRFFRPFELDILRGDYSKINKVTGWKPTTEFNDLIKKMIDHEHKMYYSRTLL